MYKFYIIRPIKENWTPAALIRRHAKENGLKVETTKYFTQYIIVNGLSYKYSHIESRETTPDGEHEKILVCCELFEK